MAYVVTDNCIDCIFTSCAAVCPVDAFHEGPDRLFINPETCIDCNACVPECPVEAIYAEAEVPPQWAGSLELARQEAVKYPVITAVKAALKGPRCVDPGAG
jgi:ferredoxin